MGLFRFIKLAATRASSRQSYQELQIYLAERTVEQLAAKGINLGKAKVLELAAGAAGHSIVLDKHAGEFVASDMVKETVFDELDIGFSLVDVNKPFPFPDASFDLVYCTSLIEHLSDPELLLAETNRILRPGGTLFLSFPPFYSLAMIGGHQFRPFHYLGERLAVPLTNFFRGTKYRSYAESWNVIMVELPTEDDDAGRYGLFPLRIDQVTGLLERAGFKVQDVFTRLTGFNTARLPAFLKDLFTWHACYIARR